LGSPGTIELDASVPGFSGSIGALLYHVALIEADYLYGDILGLREADYPPEMEALFPLPDRDGRGQLSSVRGYSLEVHLSRLAEVRTRLLGVLQDLDPARWREARRHPSAGYDVSPEWVAHHLMQHEAEHRSEIAAMLQLLRS
jgi:uncharacterized damage-inducible protein DinB